MQWRIQERKIYGVCLFPPLAFATDARLTEAGKEKRHKKVYHNALKALEFMRKVKFSRLEKGNAKCLEITCLKLKS